MNKDELVSSLRDQLALFLAHGVNSGEGWCIEHNGTWMPSQWISWVTLKTKNVEMDWPLDQTGAVDIGEQPWLSVRVKNKGLFAWLFPHKIYTLGVVGIDKAAGLDGPWWDRLQEINESMKTEILRVQEANSMSPIIPPPKEERQPSRHQPPVNIEQLKELFD